jgi:hypothetical protein
VPYELGRFYIGRARYCLQLVSLWGFATHCFTPLGTGWETRGLLPHRVTSTKPWDDDCLQGACLPMGLCPSHLFLAELYPCGSLPRSFPSMLVSWGTARSACCSQQGSLPHSPVLCLAYPGFQIHCCALTGLRHPCDCPPWTGPHM